MIRRERSIPSARPSQGGPPLRDDDGADSWGASRVADPAGTGHLAVSVPPCRAAWKTLGSRRRRVKSGFDHASRRGRGLPARRAGGAGPGHLLAADYPRRPWVAAPPGDDAGALTHRRRVGAECTAGEGRGVWPQRRGQLLVDIRRPGSSPDIRGRAARLPPPTSGPRRPPCCHRPFAVERRGGRAPGRRSSGRSDTMRRRGRRERGASRARRTCSSPRRRGPSGPPMWASTSRPSRWRAPGPAGSRPRSPTRPPVVLRGHRWRRRAA